MHRICQVIYRDIMEPMGSPIRAWEISRFLNDKDFSVFSCSISDTTREFNKNGVRIYQNKITEKKPFEASILYNVPSFSRLVKYVCKKNYVDLIHAHMFLAAMSSYTVKKSNNIPLIYDMHGLFPDEIIYHKNIHHKFRWLPWYMIEKFLRRKADFIVATSESLMELLLKLGIPENKIKSVPVGVNTDLFSPGKKKNEIRRKFSIENMDVVVYAGSVEPYQGMDTLFKCIPYVLSRKKDIVFLIVGGGIEFNKYKKIVSNSMLKKHVIMTGLIDYELMPDYIRAADIGLSLRKQSLMGLVSFPTKLTTYMACGIPCIATSNGDQRRIIQKYNTGFLFKSGDFKGLGDSILEALSEKTKLKNMGTKSKEIAEKEFSWKVLSKKYLNIYEQLLS